MKLSLCVAALLACAAATAAQNAVTTASTTTTPCPVIPGWEKCTEVSVEGDATYCIDGHVCSGIGAAPAGVKCPTKGAVAKKDCLRTLQSYTDAGTCVAPVDAQCVKIKTGAWGCVFVPASGATTSVPVSVPTTSATPAPVSVSVPVPVPTTTTPCPVIPGWETPTPAPSATAPAPTTTTTPAKQTPAPTTTTAPVQQTPAPTTTAPAKVSLAASPENTETLSSHTGLLAAGAAGVAAALAVAAVMVYKKRRAVAAPVDANSPTVYNGAVNTPV